jgi:RNA polymerase sigma factor (sigma-70 family)
MDDMTLVRDYAERNSEEAFAALVARHVNLVYSVALRKSGNPPAAEEITQAVFIVLARKAGSLRNGTILPGWLYQTTRLTAANYLRAEIRRVRREQEAYMQSLSNETEPEYWPQIEPLLEDAMGRLGDKDRDAIVLRFLEGKNLREVGAALGTSEDAAKMRVNRALEKMRNFFSKRGVVVTGAIIGGTVSANAVHAAPIGLAAGISATAVKGSAVAASTITLAKGVLNVMAWTKAKTAAVAGVAVILVIGATVVGVKAVHSARAATWPDIQGAWVGTLEVWPQKIPMMYKISKVNGSYQATGNNAYQGVREVPVSKLTYKYPSVRIEQDAIGFTYDATFDKSTMQMTGIWKQRGQTGQFIMKLDNNTDAFPEPLKESDYASRKDSDVQGYWQGTINVEKTVLRVAIRIAELPNGTLRAEGDSIDQGARGLLATSASYKSPVVRVEFGGIGGVFEGNMSVKGRLITGTWTQGDKAIPLNLERVDAPAANTQEERGDYAYTNPAELQGHWKGTLEIKQKDIKLRLAVDIAKLPKGTFSCSMISLDQGGGEIPASSVSYTPPNVRLEWKGIGAGFYGKLGNGKLTGAWRQGGGGLPLVLTRSASE